MAPPLPQTIVQPGAGAGRVYERLHDRSDDPSSYVLAHRANVSRDRYYLGVHAPRPGSPAAGLDPYGTLRDKHYKADRRLLRQALAEQRARTELLVGDLTDRQLLPPFSPHHNPLAWSVGHVAFSYELFVLSIYHGFLPDAAVPEAFAGGRDLLFDSIRVPHADRWALAPSRRDALAYLAAVHRACAELVSGEGEADAVLSHTLIFTAVHEAWHVDDLMCSRQLNGYPAAALPPSPACDVLLGTASTVSGGRATGGHAGDCTVAAMTLQLGCSKKEPFVVDGERWAHPVDLSEFRIAAAPVTNAEFVRFVDSGAYTNRRLWCYEGWRWRVDGGVTAPLYWKRVGGQWRTISSGSHEPLEPHQPVVHVSWYEAQAYCRWARRRLPTEAEWEAAACWDAREGRKKRFPWGDERPTAASNLANLNGWNGGLVDVADMPAGDSPCGCRQMVGNVWEWTATAFYPFPGFLPDFPYREQATPWFGFHKVARGGGSWHTSTLIARPEYRNFFDPGRREVWVGFRTCDIDKADTAFVRASL
eukprot:TRINITY_DN36533_c0_g1_i1.p1 TRINITY_DN36533_c0_g1~~TRINITY_DN36533_c0_g1_i1.p1  ORF type:complete len:550 (+),score=176.55 TRINITY_DN36533_c0_g1_i1:54-1652(+)